MSPAVDDVKADGLASDGVARPDTCEHGSLHGTLHNNPPRSRRERGVHERVLIGARGLEVVQQLEHCIGQMEHGRYQVTIQADHSYVGDAASNVEKEETGAEKYE